MSNRYHIHFATIKQVHFISPPKIRFQCSLHPRDQALELYGTRPRMACFGFVDQDNKLEIQTGGEGIY